MLKINVFVYKTLILLPNLLPFDSAALGGHATGPTTPHHPTTLPVTSLIKH